MFPAATFSVDYPQAGTFAIEADETTFDGARLEASVDGNPVAVLVLGPVNRPDHRPGNQPSADRNNRVNATLELPIPAGPHSIRLENTGKDWVHIHQFVLAPYAPQIAVLGKTDSDMAVLWAYRRATGQRGGGKEPEVANIKINGLSGGTYRVLWWDTDAGKVVKETTAQADDGKPLALITPPVDQDIACWITRRK